MTDPDPTAVFRHRIRRKGIVARYDRDALLRDVRSEHGDRVERELRQHFARADASAREIRAIEEPISHLDPAARQRVLRGARDDLDAQILRTGARQDQIRARLAELAAQHPELADPDYGDAA